MSNRNGQQSIRIVYLADYPQHIPTVARWHHDQWSHLSPGTSLSARTERLRSTAQKGRIPITFLALANEIPVGSASLVTTDMSILEQLSPWLASVYVKPGFRNAGIGSKLVLRAMREARSLQIPVLYLYTPDKQAFYIRLGWRERETRDYYGFQMTVMQHELQPPCDE
jgi:GNAT superfamily N-acetyltransferase